MQQNGNRHEEEKRAGEFAVRSPAMARIHHTSPTHPDKGRNPDGRARKGIKKTARQHGDDGKTPCQKETSGIAHPV